MAEKRMYNSKMNSKGLEASVGEDLAREMCENQGNRYLLLVEVHAGAKTVAEDGQQQVQLVPDLVEVVPEGHAKPVRDLLNALVAQRPEVAGQLALEGQEQPDAAEAAAALGGWDGNPDAPVDAQCPAAGCTLPEDHDGDHNAEDPDNVVKFSGKG